MCDPCRFVHRLAWLKKGIVGFCLTNAFDRGKGVLWTNLLCNRMASVPGEVKRLSFKSSYDGSEQKALLQLPKNYNSSQSTPLLIWVQGMYTDSYYGLNYIGAEAERRGWPV